MIGFFADDLQGLLHPIDAFHPDPANARTGHSIEQIAYSLKTYKQRKPIVVNLSEGGKIEAGNGTWLAAKSLGWTHVAAVRVDDDPMTAVAFGIADNRTGDLSHWDLAVLKNLIDSIDPDLDLPTGFEGDDLDALLAEMGQEKEAVDAGDAEPQASRADELQVEWGVELGQMWRLPSRTEGQEHRLICGDCADTETVERVMGEDKPVVLFTDPPYGVSIGDKNKMLNSFRKAGRNLTSIESDDLSPEKLKGVLLPAFQLAKKVIADDCSVFVTAPQGGDLGMMMMMMMEAGLKVRHVLFWVKNAPTFSMGRLDYDYQHEPILFTWGKKHRKNKRDGFGSSLWRIDKPRASAEHPTMKPPELYEQAYANHSDAGEVVYEMYCGSGTALVAAENLARQCRAVEISPAYVAVALQRYEDAFGITPELMGVR